MTIYIYIYIAVLARIYYIENFLSIPDTLGQEGVLISGGKMMIHNINSNVWDSTSCSDYIRGVSLYFRCILNSGMSCFQGCPYFRGVLISVVSLFQGCPYFRVFLFQGCPYFRGVLISGVFLFQGCPYFRGVLISEVSLLMHVLTLTLILPFSLCLPLSHSVQTITFLIMKINR